MLQTQVNYWNLVENKRHNIASEESAAKQAEASLRQAAAAEEQTRIGWQNAATNLMNAQTNAKNADTNLFNAQVNAELGRGNLQVAQQLAGSTIQLNDANISNINQRTKTEKQKTYQESVYSDMYPSLLVKQYENTSSQANLNNQRIVESQNSVMQGWVSTVSGAIRDVGSLVTKFKLPSTSPSLINNIKNLD